MSGRETSFEADVVVVGAGVVGLAVARAFALRGRDVLILEAADMIGSGISSRNSEVIHAGIYYPTGSLKARLCVAGAKQLYAFCESHKVLYRQCGKFIVATDQAERTRLESIADRAAANGCVPLRWLDAAQVAKAEPEVHCVAALESPGTGIVDTHQLMLAYLGDAEDRGAAIAFKTTVLSGAVVSGGVVLEVGGAHPARIAARLVINACGLGAPALARRIEGFDHERTPQSWLAKGNYFGLRGRSPFTRLVYPVPVAGGLGVHATIDLGGACRFGPDVEWIDHEDYDVCPARGYRFYEAIRRYFPNLPDGALTPAYSGIRPKITGPGMGDADFVIDSSAASDGLGLVHLFGIESPGLTSSLALGDAVVAAADGGDI